MARKIFEPECRPIPPREADAVPIQEEGACAVITPSAFYVLFLISKIATRINAIPALATIMTTSPRNASVVCGVVVVVGVVSVLVTVVVVDVVVRGDG